MDRQESFIHNHAVIRESAPNKLSSSNCNELHHLRNKKLVALKLKAFENRYAEDVETTFRSIGVPRENKENLLPCNSPPLPAPPAKILVKSRCSPEDIQLPPPPVKPMRNKIELPFQLPPPNESEEHDLLSKSVDFIQMPNDCANTFTSPECPASVQHTNQTQPKMGVLRNWPNSSNLAEIDPLTPTRHFRQQLSQDNLSKFDNEAATESSDVYDRVGHDSDESIPFPPPPSPPQEGFVDPFTRLETAAHRANSFIDQQERAEFSTCSESSLDLDDCDVSLSEPESASVLHTQSDTPRNRRISRSANALLLDARTTPIRCDVQPESLNNQIALRRTARIDEISELLNTEKSNILIASQTLSLVNKDPASATVTDSLGPSITLLLACQRRQALMEELNLLLHDSPVLVPLLRGEPLRARFCISSIRLSLRPEAPYTCGVGGFAVVDKNAFETFTIDGKRPVKYHMLALLKCVGEGRIYHTETVTLMRIGDLPLGAVLSASHVDLSANIEIVPLRPDFEISVEVYCMTVGNDNQSLPSLLLSTNIDSQLMDSGSKCGLSATPKRRGFQLANALLSTYSTRRKKARGRIYTCIGSPQTDFCDPDKAPMTTPSRKFARHLLMRRGSTGGSSKEPLYLKFTAFTMLSSVTVKHHYGLLFGQLPSPTDSEEKQTATSGFHEMQLKNLPRSCPLEGALMLKKAFVRLESAVVQRGFLTIFEEVSGLGVWCRYWCKLRGDQLVYWRYPEDEEAGNLLPVGRIDLRHIVLPWAVPAPSQICVRSNTLYMRSLVAVSPKWLHSSSSATSSMTPEESPSILFHASEDYRWLVRKHLLCADTTSERQSWLASLNRCLDVLQSWMPEHYACLQRYDSRLTFDRPVSAILAGSLLHNSSQPPQSANQRGEPATLTLPK